MIRCPRWLAAGLLALPVTALAERPAATRSTSERKIVPKSTTAAPVPSQKLETRSGGGTLEKKATPAPVRGGLKKLPLDVSIEMTRPAHSRDPVRITARKQGEPTFHQVKMEVRISLTCGPQMVVDVEPSSFSTPRVVFQSFETANEKTVTIQPKEAGGWKHPPDCFYSITGHIDPEQHIPEPNEHDNKQTVHYSSG